MVQAKGNFMGNLAFTFRMLSVVLGDWLLPDALAHKTSDAVACFGQNLTYAPFIILIPFTPFIIPHG